MVADGTGSATEQTWKAWTPCKERNVDWRSHLHTMKNTRSSHVSKAGNGEITVRPKMIRFCTTQFCIWTSIELRSSRSSGGESRGRWSELADTPKLSHALSRPQTVVFASSSERVGAAASTQARACGP